MDLRWRNASLCMLYLDTKDRLIGYNAEYNIEVTMASSSSPDIAVAKILLLWIRPSSIITVDEAVEQWAASSSSSSAAVIRRSVNVLLHQKIEPGSTITPEVWSAKWRGKEFTTNVHHLWPTFGNRKNHCLYSMHAVFGIDNDLRIVLSQKCSWYRSTRLQKLIAIITNCIAITTTNGLEPRIRLYLYTFVLLTMITVATDCCRIILVRDVQVGYPIQKHECTSSKWRMIRLTSCIRFMYRNCKWSCWIQQ